jgi:putative membrane-bound dehydrogenase-like protein
MSIAGFIDDRFLEEQEGELRAVAVVIEKPSADGVPSTKLAIVACDVLWIPRIIADAAVEQIEKSTGIPASHVLVNATHTHHAPSTAPAHNFGVSQRFCQELQRGIERAVELANSRLAGGASDFFFHLDEERTVGGNSRLLLPDGKVSWLNPGARREIGRPTGPFDPDFPVLDFRDASGRSRAVIYNHSTHTIGTRKENVRSPSFYGLAAQELEAELGTVVSFLQGASGSTHNIQGVSTADAIERMKEVVRRARAAATPRPVTRLASIRRPFTFTVRHFDEAAEDRMVTEYASKYASSWVEHLRECFARQREVVRPHQGQERQTWLQAMVIGDVAIVGVPAEFFTGLGVAIKQRSPYQYTYIAELANDWIGYLPDREAHELGGYQVWTGLHSYAEVGTGKRVVEEVVAMLHELAASEPPSPRTPEEEHRSFRLADPELSIELVAAEPLVESPVAIAWDADGRPFVVEMLGYPLTPGLGRVKMLLDRDGDGTYDDATVVAENLNFPTSVFPYRDGVLVTSSPDLLFLRDADGDGRADERRVLWTGFGTEQSQQLRANALHWGLDNHIYGANGRSDGELRRVDPPPGADDRPVSIRTRDFRFDPDLLRVEAISGQSQFGQAHDDWGNRFLSWNTIPIRHALLESPDLARSPELATQAIVDVAAPDDDKRVWSIGPRPAQFNNESADYYNALCGLSIYRGDALGPRYAGDAFVCESLLRVVTRRRLVPNGPTFLATRPEVQREFLTSRDAWFHPVFTTTGPDGALWIVDFYREYVEHPDYVADPEKRTQTPWRHGEERGRIWRVFRTDAAPAIRPQLSDATPAELVTALARPVSWWRETSQRLLIERQDGSVVPALESLARQGNELARAHALWTLDGLGALGVTLLVDSLADRNPHVREQALRLSATRLDSADVLQAALELTGDSDPAIRFRLGLALGSRGTRILDGLARLLSSHELSRWDALAAVVATGPNGGPLVRELVLADENWLRRPTSERIQLLQEIGQAMGRPPQEQRNEFLAWLDDLPEEFATGKVAIQAGLARSQRDQAKGEPSSRAFIENANPDRDRVVEAYRSSLSMQGDGKRGARHYAAHCLSCHAVQGFGPSVGPDITSVATRAKQELLVDILDPSRRVSPDSLAYTAVTTGGLVIAGIIAAETDDSVTLRREKGEEVTFRLVELTDLRPTQKSIMPDGLEAKLDAQAVADLLAFVQSPAKELVESAADEP